MFVKQRNMTSFFSFISGCSNLKNLHRYLNELILKVDFRDEENFSLFFVKKLKTSSTTTTTAAAASQPLSEEETTATASAGEDHGSNSSLKEIGGRLDNSALTGYTAASDSRSLCVQERFIDARRNKKRDAKIEATLKGNVELSKKFHNLTRLLMYKIMRVFSDHSNDQSLS